MRMRHVIMTTVAEIINTIITDTAPPTMVAMILELIRIDVEVVIGATVVGCSLIEVLVGVSVVL